MHNLHQLPDRFLTYPSTPSASWLCRSWDKPCGTPCQRWCMQQVSGGQDFHRDLPGGQPASAAFCDTQKLLSLNLRAHGLQQATPARPLSEGPLGRPPRLPPRTPGPVEGSDRGETSSGTNRGPLACAQGHRLRAPPLGLTTCMGADATCLIHATAMPLPDPGQSLNLQEETLQACVVRWCAGHCWPPPWPFARPCCRWQPGRRPQSWRLMASC